MPAQHEIPIRLTVIEEKQHAVPQIPTTMNLGDSVHYFNPDGLPTRVIFTFDGSPFDTTELRDTDPPKPIINKGQFVCGCSLIVNGAEVGWKPGDPDTAISGGIHDVGPK
jgi:hypothetical protein